jgi:hypothetical protein
MNPDVQGRVYPGTTLTVTPEHVASFARVVGQDEPGVPPTFLTVAEFAVFGSIVADPELELDFERVVHGDQEYEWHRPLRVGEALEVVSRIASIRERGANGFLTIEVDVTAADGEHVATARATMIERGSP